MPRPVDEAGAATVSAASVDTKTPRHRSPGAVLTAVRSRPDLLLVAYGLALGVAVCFPFFHGYLLLLDWVRGARSPIVPPALYGLKGGLTGGVPFSVVSNLLVHLTKSVGTWLPFLIVFPLGALSIGRFVGGSPLARVGAATVYLVNPFVFDRLYAGQVALLLGYAVMPFAIGAMRRLANGGKVAPVALWSAGCVALSPHFAWILAVPAVFLVVTATARLRSSGKMAAAGALTALISAYVVVGPLVARLQVAKAGGQLASYATSGDPRVGIYVNVLGLYGFWRAGPVEPKDLFAGWPLFLLALVVLAGYGLWCELRDGERATALALLLTALFGYFLALGSSGPTGFAYRFAVEHLPGFSIMREAEKFSMLIALLYAFGIAKALGRVAESATITWKKAATWALAIGLPFVYTPNLVDGLGGQVTASALPASWEGAAPVVGDTNTLFLPWNSYVSVPFAGGRVIASPGKSFLGSSVVASGDPGGNYSFNTPTDEDLILGRLAAEGYSTRRARELLNQLAIGYVVLAKIGEWQSYGWLAHQRGLQLVFDRGGIEIWRVEEEVPSVRWVAELVAGKSFLSFLRDPYPGRYLAVAHGRGRTSRNGPSPSAAVTHKAVTKGGRLLAHELSPTAWAVSPSPAGFVELPITYQRGWEMDGHPAIRLAGGNLAVRAPRKGATLEFQPWSYIDLSYWLSLATLLLVVGWEVVRHVIRPVNARSQ